MNILFFITPKIEVAYISEDFTLRQTIEKMEYHRYSAIPILDRGGHYIGTLTEGDLLRVIKQKHDLNLHEAEDVNILQVPRRWKTEAVNINCDIEDLVQVALRQNFVPVVDDDNVFIGIITRKAIIQYAFDRGGLSEKSRQTPGSRTEGQKEQEEE